MSELQKIVSSKCRHFTMAEWKQAAAELAALRAELAEAREALEPFASAGADWTNNDKGFGAGGLWFTDYASGGRGEVWTGGHINRRQLHIDDLCRAAAVLAEHPKG